MIPIKSGPYLYVACGIITFVIFLSWRSLQEVDSTSSKWSIPKMTSSSVTPKVGSNYLSAGWGGKTELDITSEIGRSSNATLGFEKVFVLGLKDRSDKRDAIALAASLTGFQVEFHDSVNGDEMSDKARPPGMALKGGALGCWRGHLDIIRSVVQNKLSSAFIMEDDADWDIRLLNQMPDLAKGVRTLSDIPLEDPQLSPYGDDWDVIWPGHCGEVLPQGDERRYIIENDETVAPKAHQPSIHGLKEMPEGTRWVHKAGAPICSFGYAVSYRGAEKILMALAVKGAGNLAIDNALAYLCRDGYLNMQCYSVEPQLFHHHRPAGPISKDSDINSPDPSKIRDKGFTETIVLSARLNLEKVILGSQEWVTQW